MALACPEPECETEAADRCGLGIHWSANHEGTPPWRIHTCDYCGDRFEKAPSKVSGEWSFCSRECHGKWDSENKVGPNAANWKGGKQTFTCDECGEEFTRWGSKPQFENVYCSTQCATEKQNIGDGYQYYGPDWPEQREKARERDGYVCQRIGCGRTECRNGADLHVHHLIPFREFDDREEANALENLVTVCAEHHNELEQSNDQASVIKR